MEENSKKEPMLVFLVYGRTREKYAIFREQFNFSARFCGSKSFSSDTSLWFKIHFFKCTVYMIYIVYRYLGIHGHSEESNK